MSAAGRRRRVKFDVALLRADEVARKIEAENPGARIPFANILHSVFQAMGKEHMFHQIMFSGERLGLSFEDQVRLALNCGLATEGKIAVPGENGEPDICDFNPRGNVVEAVLQVMETGQLPQDDSEEDGAETEPDEGDAQVPSVEHGVGRASEPPPSPVDEDDPYDVARKEAGAAFNRRPAEEQAEAAESFGRQQEGNFGFDELAERIGENSPEILAEAVAGVDGPAQRAARLR